MEVDSFTSTYDYGARRYIPAIGRYMTSDIPGLGEVSNPYASSYTYSADGFAYKGDSLRLRYRLRDHLGNPVVICEDVNKDGRIDLDTIGLDVPEVIERMVYYPFGLSFDGLYDASGSHALGSRYKFGGKEVVSGVYDFGARYYYPAIGRFMGVDPLAEKAPGWTPYRYGFNNPIRYTDPDGQWEKDANGNLVAEKGDNAWTLAKYLNTSSEMSIKMLGQQGYSVNDKGILYLKVGDVFNVEHSSSKPESREDLGFMGNNIRKRAGSEFSKNMFENYWNGNGDVELSGERFAGILMYVKENNPKASDPTSVNFKGADGSVIGTGSKRAVSFYSSSEYDRVFGTSTLYYNSKGNIIGFYDNYDFDSKPWGERSTKNEIITRAVETFSPAKAKDFKIRFGYSNRE